MNKKNEFYEIIYENKIKMSEQVKKRHAPYTEEEMKQFFEENGYLLEKYTKGSNSIQITRHLECGNLYPVTFANLNIIIVVVQYVLEMLQYQRMK